MQGCILFSCQDKVGITAELAQFFTDHKANIVQYEQYTDAGHFFARLAWTLNTQWNNEAAFVADFKPLEIKFNAHFSTHFSNRPQSIGLLASGEPHALIEIINKQESGELGNTNISFILSNNQENQSIAQRHNIPFHFIPTTQNPAEYEAAQLEIINGYKPDVLGLARYMKVLTADFIANFGKPIVNIHHSFLPSFVGAKPYEMAYERGVKLMGATAHFVTPELDQGPIIEQSVTRIPAGSNPIEMKQMGRDLEKQVFATALKKVLQHKTIIYDNKTMIFS